MKKKGFFILFSNILISLFVVVCLFARTGQSAQNVINLNAVAANESKVNLTWQAASDPESGISKYYIYRDGSLVGESNTNSFSEFGLSKSTTYTYEVSAVNGGGLESAKSSPVLAITLPIPTKPVWSPQGKLVWLSQGNLVWLPQGIDLTRHTMGPFTVKIRVEGLDKQRHPSIYPRIIYYIGTGSSPGYFDMINEGDNVWRFDIPDPNWNRYRSESLHYQVKVFDEKGNVITKSSWEKELIDSFIQQDN